MPHVNPDIASIAGWIPPKWKCNPVFPNVRDCLLAAHTESLEAAHYAAVAAGMIRKPGIHDMAHVAAVNNIEADAGINNAIDAMVRAKEWELSMGPYGAIIAVATRAMGEEVQQQAACAARQRIATFL
mmetsp:Transcript_69410/g.129614  ORF Transcript_69410/g.129614 Transcript_69410/m.129614 type:complete len:128 (+) Transcript_69410:147-530(+)